MQQSKEPSAVSSDQDPEAPTARPASEMARLRQREHLPVFREITLNLSRRMDLPDLMEAISRQAMLVFGALDLSVLCRIVVEAIARTLGYTHVSLYLLQSDTLRLEHQVGYGNVIAAIPLTQGVCGRVGRTAVPQLLEDVSRDPEFLGAIEGVTSEICVPLFDRGRVAGVLNVESTAGVRLTDDDLRLLVALSGEVGVAIGRARLHAEVQESERKHMEEAPAQARDQALEASRLKSEFVATMSHEIRTLMSSILGMNELLLDTQLTPEQQEFALGVHDAGQALLAIIDDILDFSKIEAGKLVFDEADFDPRATIQRTVDLFVAKAQAKGLDLRVLVANEVPAMVRGDPLRLRQVLVNLISNALKFTERGEVVVEVALESMTEDHVILYFSVTDTGSGLSEAARRRLFQPFTQADGSTTRRYGGTGLGLAICARLVEMMGGEIGAEGEERRGSIFWFTARFGRAVAHGPAEAMIRLRPRIPVDAARAATQGWRILLAADNPLNSRLTVLQLKKLGYRVDAVRDGAEAAARYTQEPAKYDLILMDCQTPQLDGFEATRAIRAAESGFHHIPIVAMTADALQGDRGACLEAGMDDYISKPVRWVDLHEVVGRWLSPAAGAPSVASPAGDTHAPGLATEELSQAEPGPLDRITMQNLRRLAPPDEPQALIELIDAFLESTQARLPALREAVESGVAQQVSQIAHSLKGSTGSFGAIRLSSLLGQLEAMGKKDILAGAMERLEEIEAEFERVQAAFAEELRTPTPNETGGQNR